MAVLIQATGVLARSAEHQQRIEEVRCYVLSATSRLSESVLRVPRRRKTHRHLVNPLLVDPPLMETRRRIFADMDLQADVNYTRRAFCWYDFEITNLNLANQESAATSIQDWMSTQVKAIQSHLAIPIDSHTMPKNDIVSTKTKAVVLSTIGLNIPWREDLFPATKTRTHDFHLNAKEKVTIPMLRSIPGNFNILQTQLFVSVAVPLSRNLSHIGGGSLILVRPHNHSLIEQIRDDLFQTSVQLHAFMENAKNAKLINTTLVVPRLSLPISQEWISRATQVNKNQSLTQEGNQDEANMILLGGTVQVRQDVWLYFQENTRPPHVPDSTLRPSAANESLESEEFHLDVPFLFVLALDIDVVAFGQVSNPQGGSKITSVPTKGTNKPTEPSPAPSWLQSIFG
ncbi:hypothetical protein TCAL_08540 [Tigriopus californicus]|uniref:Serpin domain-containing protein n=2 Tax=Tigriopus californicus TaxID=6832 RepID=A0A553PDF8_TIGCA|nr:hypothetical protein TCAL_08540 [Tigriopus californicus]